MILEGRAIVLGDNIDTDVIIPAPYLKGAKVDPVFLGTHLMEGLDPQFSQRVTPGAILVVGKNFGCGSSREHAVLAIKGAGIAAVVAKSFARIFFRNAINQALPTVVCPQAVDAACDGTTIRIDLERSLLTIGDSVYPIQPLAGEVREIFRAGGLVEYVRRRVTGA